jgi:hypothetical protein
MKGFPIPGASGLLDGTLPVGAGALPPDDDFVPKNTRRRISRLIAQALSVTRSAGGLLADPAAPLVFATANGEINTIGTILPALLADEPQVSPTLFHNSVHNAAPGYWAILARRFAAATTVTMGPATFEAALLEAWTRLQDDAPEVQVTAGDEAIATAPWADPAHCTRDFCGSLRIARDAPGPVPGRLLSVAFLPGDGPVGEAAALAARAGAATFVDDPDLLPGGARHPCAGLHAVLAFLLQPGPEARLLLRRASPHGGRYVAVFQRDAHA